MNHSVHQFTMYIDVLARACDIVIALPLHIRGPLQGIFFNDGHNVWDDETATYKRAWRLGEVLDFNQLQIGVVSVSCAPGLARLDEYAPFEDASIVNVRDWIHRPCGGHAKTYVQAMIDCVLPLATQNHTFKPTWMMVGSSMGGMVSLTAMIEHPNVFTHIAGLSNAFWFAQATFLSYVEAAELHEQHHVYLDVGLAESSDPIENEKYLKSNEAIAQALLKKPLGSLTFVRVVKGEHHEASWSQRIGAIVQHMCAREQ